MPCYFPLQGYLRSDNYGRRWVWSAVLQKHFNDGTSVPPKFRVNGDLQAVPCGRCVGCRLERSRSWAVRCVHESQLYEYNCFITLTYAPEHLPDDRSLDLKHFQKFLKRFRKKFHGFCPVVDEFGGTSYPIRYFHCGEYGSKLGRPHYHALIFNFDFPDKKFWKLTSERENLYTSEILSQLWPFGFSTVGGVTFKSAAYVARYVMKKITGPKADDHYMGLKPEYTTMSLKPGIGAGWFAKFRDDVYPDDFVVLNGKKFKPPRYYDNLFALDDPFLYDDLKDSRVAKAARSASDNTGPRLHVKAKVKSSSLSQLKRSMEDSDDSTSL